MTIPVSDWESVIAQLQQLYLSRLPAVIAAGHNVAQQLLNKEAGLRRAILAALIEKAFLFLREVEHSFRINPVSGYYTSAVLARTLMETVSDFLVIFHESNGEMVAACVREGRNSAERRRSGLARLAGREQGEVKQVAEAEEKRVKALIDELDKMAQTLPVTPIVEFPTMRKRCESLGKAWPLLYFATYGELSEAVHTGIAKISHGPSVALRSPNRGGAVAREHARALSSAFEFWSVAFVDAGRKEAGAEPQKEFETLAFGLLEEVERVQGKLPEEIEVHYVRF